MYHCQITHKPIKEKAILIPLQFSLTFENKSIFDFIECWRFSAINPIVCEMLYDKDSIAYNGKEYDGFHELVDKLSDRFSPFFMLINFDWWACFQETHGFTLYEKINSLHAKKPLEFVFNEIMRRRMIVAANGIVVSETPMYALRLYNFHYFAAKVGISIHPFNYSQNTSDFTDLLELCDKQK